MNCENLKLSTTQEVWTEITNQVVPNIKPYYYVSNHGRIGSMASGSFKILTTAKDDDGYLYAGLSLYPMINNKNHIRYSISKRVNRLVIMSFYPIPDNYKDLEVNHINNIRDDNHLWNLEWVTPIENVLHAMNSGNIEGFKGSEHPLAKLTDSDVYEMIELIKTENYTYKQLGDRFNISPKTVHSILSKRSWNHLDLDISIEDFDSYRRASFTTDECDQICKFFESADINNKSKYPSKTDILKDCFYSLNLDKKYNFKSKLITLSRILEKSYQYSNKLDKYNYNFIR